MNLSLFHFAEPGWLWALTAIPAVALIYALFYARKSASDLLERFADRHILPHILNRAGARGRSIRLPLLLWSLAWLCGIIAMAGPRWSYTETPIFKKTQDIVFVLDLSQSMNAVDVKPSRVARALQEIADIMTASPGTSIGLVAYAAVPHMVTPLTDDFRTLRALLPALDTSLVTVQGDLLEPAIQMAARMLDAEPGDSKAIIVLSDGDFTDANVAVLADAARGNPVYAIGVGTEAGTTIAGPDGQWQTDNLGKVIVYRLQAERLRMLAAAAHGAYMAADYGNADTSAILGRIGVETTKAQEGQVTLRVWDERFYLPAILLMAMLLPLFRRGAAFPVLLVLLTGALLPSGAHAASVTDLFRNPQQRARAAYERGDYKDALAQFDTPYRRGVAAYRVGDYEEARDQFQIAAGNNLDALYNLGNALLMMRLPQDAIDSYEAVLKQRPHDARAEHNLEIARKMLKLNDIPSQDPPKPPQNQQSQNNQNNPGAGQSNQNQNNPNQNKQQNQNNQNQDNQKSQNQKQAGQPPENRQNPQQNTPPRSNPDQPKIGQNPPQQQPPQQQQQQQPQQPQQQPQGGGGQQPRPPQSAARGIAQPVKPGSGDDSPSQQAANAWLGHIQNDPASLLRNQFRIEDQASTAQTGTKP